MIRGTFSQIGLVEAWPRVTLTSRRNLRRSAQTSVFLPRGNRSALQATQIFEHIVACPGLAGVSGLRGAAAKRRRLLEFPCKRENDCVRKTGRMFGWCPQ